MVKHLFCLFIIVFVSCSSQPEKIEQAFVETNHQPQQENTTASPNFSTQFFLVDSIDPKQGFGYNILVDGAIFIHQTSIPAVSGNSAFITKEKAELVANLVIHKLKNNIMPPSVSKHELDSLNILTP